MTTALTNQSAARSGTFAIGGDLKPQREIEEEPLPPPLRLD
jgi:hypothetical protein